MGKQVTMVARSCGGSPLLQQLQGQSGDLFCAHCRAWVSHQHSMALTKHSDKLSLFIQQCLREHRIFYSTNEVGEVFRNYVMWSDTFSIKN